MADYREQTIEGNIKTWRRAYKIICENPYNEVPSISFHEEEKVQLPDGSVLNVPIHGQASVSQALNDPTEVIPLISPITGEQIGTATYGDLYAMIYSLYIHLALERDEQE
jgi:hypothetical protein